ncbi:MAG TPA: SDR family oxidoreductase [Verrucomicrobiae bacterium]|jgi:3-oxoacyl-[acyl-carrier protein] reductase|nr:SDR family oxidoreductase [Verrucomicrobiae bacterium]
MDLGLKGKVVLVTGASRGIGRAIAEAFATEGAHVAIAARNAQEVQAVAAEIARQTKATVEGFATDVMQADQIKELVDHAAKRFGTIHILVNNAGGVGAFAPFEQLTDDDWLEILNLNVLSAVRATRAALPFMQKQKWGRIINISSESGTQPDAFMPHYNASKAALNNLTKSLSKAYAQDGILVNTVSPAFIMTPLVANMLKKMASEQGVSPEQVTSQFLANNRPHIELKRPGTSEEVAGAVLFLASEQASFITGTNLRVDGGSVASL